MALNKKNLLNIFYIFLIAHVIIWTLIPSLTNENLPLDTIEALAWGSNLDWGFAKHPPMSAFIAEFFYKIFGSQDWSYYLLSQRHHDHAGLVEHRPSGVAAARGREPNRRPRRLEGRARRVSPARVRLRGRAPGVARRGRACGVPAGDQAHRARRPDAGAGLSPRVG